MSAFISTLSDEDRARSIRLMMADGMSRTDANTIVDLGCHAEVEALKAILRVVKASPSHLAENALSLALARTIARCRLEMDAMLVILEAAGWAIVDTRNHD